MIELLSRYPTYSGREVALLHIALVFVVSSCGEPSVASRQAEHDRAAAPGWSETTAGTEEKLGIVDRASLLAAEPLWQASLASVEPSADASQLTDVPPGAKVDIILGTWCPDSRREVTRLWAAFDAAGRLPFEVRHIAVDRSKQAPGNLLDGLDLRYVPTIIVYRNGEEVGRIIESTTGPIELELLALLRGDKRGAITARSAM